jgi:hypothetical protein
MHGTIVTASVALGLYLVSHLIATVWWASKVTTSLHYIQDALEKSLRTMEDEASKREAETRALWSSVRDIPKTIHDKIKDHREMCPAVKP